MTPEDTISYLLSPELQTTLFPAKVVFLLFSIFFLAGTIWFLAKTTWLRKIFLQDLIEVLTFKAYWTRRAAARWNKIIKRLEVGRESDYKLAIIEADAMLNDTLKQMGYVGDTLGERLEKVSKETLSNLEEVWEAHRVRNDIVHDPDYKLTLENAKRALNIFGETFRQLELF